MKRSLNEPDGTLILLTLEGNRKAMEELINRHRAWIFQKALGMIRDPQIAEDVTQEVQLVILTRLSTFRGESSFRTWLHRIITNHVITLKKSRSRESCLDFSRHGKRLDPDSILNLTDSGNTPVDQSLLVEEAGGFYMMGMLLCLNLEQRLIFILGEVFEVNDEVGSQVFEISRVNFRKKLSRARKLVYGYVRERYDISEEKKVLPFHIQRNGSPKNGNGSSKARMGFEQRYHLLRAYFRAQFRKMLKQCKGVKTPRPVEMYRKMLDDDELKRIIHPLMLRSN